MSEHSATLLSFPAREDDRLRLALRGLVAALDAQSDAVAALRGELRSLASAMGGLQGSFSTYGAELDSTGAALRQARAEAQALERTADGWIAATKA
ncbi:hypothetical protein [Roseicella aquatilis]|uniref:Uncharacterized protein n=1 Tax=Roseicella aquatilis TaxID=2527868 RepID=A0A4R4D513_9PROT|nr:hypothetical protein [Roseicella aquatilis]TCZ55381.1 hypothetical protein EXY23_21435 [Roseicella aquatilis]